MQSDDDLQANIDRTVGVSALRRMARLAGEGKDRGDQAPATPTLGADDEQRANIERTVGFSAVRRMSKLAAEINDQERRAQRISRRLLLSLAAVLLLLLIMLLIEPGVLAWLLRRLADA